MTSVLRKYTLPLFAALLLHVATAWALYDGWTPEEKRSTIVQPPSVMANLVVMQPKQQPKVDPVKVAQEKKAAQLREAKQREAAKQKKLEQERLARLEKEKKAEADRLARLKEAERKAAEEAQREQERLDRLARLSELASTSLEEAIADESQDLQAVTDETLVQSYHAAIYQRVRDEWSVPLSARNGMQALLQVELVPTGEVISVSILESSGDAVFDRSAEAAVRDVQKFDVPQENRLFEAHFRRFRLLFRPEDLLR